MSLASTRVKTPPDALVEPTENRARKYRRGGKSNRNRDRVCWAEMPTVWVARASGRMEGIGACGKLRDSPLEKSIRNEMRVGGRRSRQNHGPCLHYTGQVELPVVAGERNDHGRLNSVGRDRVEPRKSSS